ncbi:MULTISPECIES: acetate/propionate family kinase [unclassified Candidatus Frackibacter]|uniref:acetate/propionate family kinase n=1 Tax=unclassified Candidatus Frackibacter TaxID=2648818 RepID=UPI0008891886|nr:MULTISPECIES: acetate kinase [unclassified Candidatus Frackibacter]SDC48110.1 acetate kinase [Candidatus Frackibacter sp. WG11]SEM95429.1 acetate kinase [Candidatus Frackibacter sp. WG12]SFL73276.1 acetate kinase [Candidatus Frackibacter sp. WG13]
MKVLVLNCGSSSAKYQLINMEDESPLASGVVERIGIDGAFLTHEPVGSEEVKIENEIPDHSVAIKMVIDALLDDDYGVIDSMDEISAVGHRVVHGGENFADSALIDDEVYNAIDEVKHLAPLHNPPNLLGIQVSQELMPETPDVAVFDTAFHQTMPAKSYMYALPYEWYEDYGVRRYGFHGTSHKYVARRAAEILDKPFEDLKIITCHLGNGASMAAVKGGKVMDTSMGLTPLEGLVMGTRCGDIDPAIVPFMMENEGYEPAEMDNVLNKKSGVAGLSGVSNDFRDIGEEAENGNEQAQIAIDVFAQRVKKYIGSYSAVLGGADVVVFTAGIGENAIDIRAKILDGLDYLGLTLDEEKNDMRGEEQVITTDDSDNIAIVVPTNEELVIARDTKRLVEEAEEVAS